MDHNEPKVLHLKSNGMRKPQHWKNMTRGTIRGTIEITKVVFTAITTNPKDQSDAKHLGTLHIIDDAAQVAVTTMDLMTAETPHSPPLQY